MKRHFCQLLIVMAMMFCAKPVLAFIELTPLPPGRAEAWQERMYAALDEFHANIWNAQAHPWMEPWKKIVNEKVHSQPTVEKVIKAAHKELYKRFDYTPDYDPEKKRADQWSLVSGFSDDEVKFAGDCEDYALLIAWVLTRHTERGSKHILVGSSDDGTHAVLLVRDKDTNYVVDSRIRRVFKNELPGDFKPRLAISRTNAFAVRVQG